MTFSLSLSLSSAPPSVIGEIRGNTILRVGLSVCILCSLRVWGPSTPIPGFVQFKQIEKSRQFQVSVIGFICEENTSFSCPNILFFRTPRRRGFCRLCLAGISGDSLLLQAEYSGCWHDPVPTLPGAEQSQIGSISMVNVLLGRNPNPNPNCCDPSLFTGSLIDETVLLALLAVLMNGHFLSP